MPIFEYECGGCGKRFEHLVRHTSPDVACPACQGRDLRRLMSLAAVSSEHTQKRALRGAEQRTAALRHDRAYEDHKALHEHHH